jgi:hypothetical protein
MPVLSDRKNTGTAASGIASSSRAAAEPGIIGPAHLRRRQPKHRTGLPVNNGIDRPSQPKGHDMTEPVRRVHYFFGQLLTPEDLEAEQGYHRQMRYRHNRLIGQGIVEGFGVAVGDGSTVVVSPGLAVDGYGRELVLTDETRVDVSGGAEPDGSRDLVATWAEEPDSFVAPTDGTDERAFTRWLERPRLELVPPGAAPAESVVLGRVQFSSSEVNAVDLCSRSGWHRARPGEAQKPGEDTAD